MNTKGADHRGPRNDGDGECVSDSQGQRGIPSPGCSIEEAVPPLELGQHGALAFLQLI